MILTRLGEEEGPSPEEMGIEAEEGKTELMIDSDGTSTTENPEEMKSM